MNVFPRHIGVGPGFVIAHVGGNFSFSAVGGDLNIVCPWIAGADKAQQQGTAFDFG